MRLISAAWVLPVTAPPIAQGAVVVGERADRDEARAPEIADRRAEIVAVGSRADLRREFPGLVEWRAEGALCPALVNAHAHLELSALGAPAVPGGDGVINWTRRLAARLAERAAGAEEVEGLAAAVAAAHAARDFGTGAVGDVGNGVAGWIALGRADLEGVFFHELVGSREARTGDAMADAARQRAAVPVSERPVHVAAIAAPHAPYSVGPSLMRRIFAAAARAGCATSIHVAEDADEVALLRDGTGGWPDILRALAVPPGERIPGLSPTAYIASLGGFAGGSPPPLLVHMVHADAEDRRRARDSGATVVLCPRSNLHIGGRLPDVPAFIDDGVKLALGTDSLASNRDLSLWGEMSTLAAHFPDIPARVWFHAATCEGAAALGLGHLGAIAPGRCPGLIDVALPQGAHDDPERALLTPGYQPAVRWVLESTVNRQGARP